jgi:hypothetical protein
MSKVLIVPCYKDFYKLDWVKEFNKRTNYTFKIIIYEKRDKIKKEIKLNEQHYLLPAYGEGTFQLFYHIIKNYNNLEDTIHYTKSHWVPRFSSIELFLNEIKNKDDLYLQHTTNIRKFIPCLGDISHLGHKEGIIELLKKNNRWNNQKIYSTNWSCYNCKNNIQCFKCNLMCIDDKELYDVIFNYSYTKNHTECMKLIKEIFPSYKENTIIAPRCIDGSYILKKELILYHSVETYKKILNFITYVLKSHDEIITFTDLFFTETKRLYIEKNCK